MHTAKPSSFINNLVVVHQTLGAYGLDADAIVDEAGIDMAMYQKTKQRVPADLMDSLFSISVEKTGDPAFGLKCVEFLNPAGYHALGMGLLYSTTLRDFCQRFVRFFALISTLDMVEFKESRDHATLSLWPVKEYSEATQNFDSSCFAAMILKFIRLIYQPDYTPLKVLLTWEPDDKTLQRFTTQLGCDIELNASVSAIHFDKNDMDIEFPASNVELARQNDKVVVEFLERTEKVDLPARVYAKIIELLPSGECSRETIAQLLHMSPSAFQEKLKKAGTSYQELLDETRKDLAESYIRHAELSISEVAYLLGFTDSSNFSRAFKRWLGVSPRDYRNQL